MKQILLSDANNKNGYPLILLSSLGIFTVILLTVNIPIVYVILSILALFWLLLAYHLFFIKHKENTITLSKVSSQSTMLKDIISFSNETVRDILTARPDITDLDARTPFREVIQIVSDCKYSRIPVYSGTKDNIIGLLYIKDLLPYLSKGDDFKWCSLLRPHISVPETKKIDNLLREFQSQKIHFAIVIDEYGGVAGIVTLEDIIEEVVGEINDEFDDDHGPYIVLNKNTFIFDAKISTANFCKVMGLDDDFFEEFGEEASTLASLLLEIINDIPRKNLKIRYKQFMFEVLGLDERHITKVRVIRY